jgi:hypothetical protein
VLGEEEDSVFKRPFLLPHGSMNTSPDGLESVYGNTLVTGEKR